MVLSWNVLFSPSMVIENFARYSSLHPWSPSVCSISAQDLLAFRVSIEKSYNTDRIIEEKFPNLKKDMSMNVQEAYSSQTC